MDRITDRPDMTSAVYRGRKESTQTNKETKTYLLITSHSLNGINALGR